VLKAAGKPFPDFTEDEVLNYLITEAVFIKASAEEKAAQKEAEEEAKREQWKQEAKAKLNAYR
jgi:hypothetical protein